MAAIQIEYYDGSHIVEDRNTTKMVTPMFSGLRNPAEPCLKSSRVSHIGFQDGHQLNRELLLPNSAGRAGEKCGSGGSRVFKDLLLVGPPNSRMTPHKRKAHLLVWFGGSYISQSLT